MSRDLASNFSSALSADRLDVFFAVEMNFDTDPLRFWSGHGDLSFDSKTWTGSGSMLEIATVEETLEVAAKGATLTLSGLPSDLVSLALSEPYQGRECKIYFGARDADDASPDAPSTVLSLIFAGDMDQMNIEEGPETSTISLYVESRLIRLQRPVERRFTHESQKSRFPNDKGFEFVESLQNKRFKWGR